jgi:hypothetical protein
MLLTLSLRPGEGRSIILASATPANIVWKRLPIAMSNASSAQARALRPLGRVIQQPSHCTSEGIAHSPLGQ